MRKKSFHLPPTPVSGPERSAIYAWVSSLKQRGRREDEDDKLSLPDQEASCRSFCQDRGYLVNEKYIVGEVSSGDNVHLPLLEGIYAAAKRGG